MTGRRVFVTGGASGLGRALAAALVARGDRVLIGDRDEAAGRAAAEALGAAFLRCDVTRAEDLAAAADRMRADWGGADLVIANAGVAQMGPLAATGEDDWRWILDVNLMGTVRTVDAFTPLLRGGGGTFLLIASMAAMLHLPGAAAYNATKAAVLALAETMMLELEPDGIATHVACPGFFRTNLARDMRAGTDAARAMTTRLVERARLDADDVAAAILAGLDRGETHILTHPRSRRAWLTKRLLPVARYLAGMRREAAALEARMARPPRR